MGGLPNSTKNQISSVSNKFNTGRDVTPNKTINQSQTNGSVIAPGRAAHQGF